MDVKELIRAGKIADARKELVEYIKASPADSGKRTLLFQVLSFYGEWEKAKKHLEILAAQDPEIETGIQVYLNLVNAEIERAKVFNNGMRPAFLPKAPPYMELYYNAADELKKEHFDKARELFEQLDDQITDRSGSVNGKDFNSFKDTDTLLSPFLEIIVHERYVWIPLESIRELVIPTPEKLFDLIWVPAIITTWEGLTLNCYMPVTYHGSSDNEDDRIKTGRMTDWVTSGGIFLKGMGQHVFEIGDEDMGILEIREVIFKQDVNSGE